jgi:hypothetical protein
VAVIPTASFTRPVTPVRLLDAEGAVPRRQAFSFIGLATGFPEITAQIGG